MYLHLLVEYWYDLGTTSVRLSKLPVVSAMKPVELVGFRSACMPSQISKQIRLGVGRHVSRENLIWSLSTKTYLVGVLRKCPLSEKVCRVLLYAESVCVKKPLKLFLSLKEIPFLKKLAGLSVFIERRWPLSVLSWRYRPPPLLIEFLSFANHFEDTQQKNFCVRWPKFYNFLASC